MATLSVLPVQYRSVGSDPVVPDDHCLLFPLQSRLEVRAERDVVEQEFQQEIALFLLKALYTVSASVWGAGMAFGFGKRYHHAPGELTIDVESLIFWSVMASKDTICFVGTHFFTSHGMCSHKRMHVAHGLSSDGRPASESRGCLLMAGVDNLKAMKALLEFWRQTTVRFCHVCEQSVTTCSRAIEAVQERCAGWLNLVGSGYVSLRLEFTTST